MQNKLIDLNNHLFAQLERLGNEEMTPENLREEVARSGAITSVAKEIISNARLALDAETRFSEMPMTAKKPAMLS